MMRNNYNIILIILLLSSSQANAVNSKDPVGWLQSGGIPPHSKLYASYDLHYRITNHLGFKIPLTVYTKPSSNEFTIKNDCMNRMLPLGGSCMVDILFTPKQLGAKSLNLSIAYGNNTVHLPVVSTNTLENSDPVIVESNGSIPTETKIYNHYQMQYVVTSNLPFDMTAPLSVSHQSATDEFIIKENCSGQKLPAHAQCTIDVNFTPTTAGLKALDMSLAYDSFSLKLPTIESKAYSVGVPQLTTRMVNALPPFTRISTSYDVKLEITNTGSADANNLTIMPNYPKGFSETNHTCTNTLASGASCFVAGTFSSTVAGNVNVNWKIDYAGGTVFAESATKVVDPGLGRIITFINHCDEEVWFGVHGKEAEDICVDNTDCPVGTLCRDDKNDGAGMCYWPNLLPHLPRGEYLLNAHHGVNYVVALDVNPDMDVIWQGEIAGRTNCVGGHCDTADCHGGSGYDCPVGTEFDKPATIASFTLSRHVADKYKVDLSQGYNLPVSISPTVTKPSSERPSICGTPGAKQPSHPLLAACAWQFTPPTNEFVHVKPVVYQACSSDADCKDEEVCGLSEQPNQHPALQKSCGKKIGYWSASAACAKYPTDAESFFHCRALVGQATNQYPLADLYSCAAPNEHDAMLNSCYAHNDSQCCGCVNWDELGMTVPAAPQTPVCLSHNPDWMTHVLPTIQWLKQACPTATVYPHDDGSVFSCEANSGGDNQVDYTVTFCPQ